MMPTVANKNVTLSSGKGKVDFGFQPDYVEILNITNLGTNSTSTMLAAKGKPNDGTSNGKMIGFVTNDSTASTVDHFDVGQVVTQWSGKAVSDDDYLGLDIDFSGTSGVGTTDELLITGFRTNS